MAYTLRPAQRDQAKPLIGLYSESGCGKTWSALLLARGFVGQQGRIGMIETESGRGEAYVGVDPVGEYLVCPIRGSFSPHEYGEAISACEKGDIGALIIDSASHEWEAVGGVLDMAAKNQESGKKGPLVWQRPKMDHQKEFVLRLMTTPIPLVIVNMRAKYPMYQVTAEDLQKWEKAGRPGAQPKVGEWARSWRLEPKQSEDVLFEMFTHGWLDKEHRLNVTKYPRAIPEFRDVLRDKEPISIETGQRLAAWSKGSAAPRDSIAPPSPGGHAGAAVFISSDELRQLRAAFDDCDKAAEGAFLRVARSRGIDTLDKLPSADVPDAHEWVARRKQKLEAQAQAAT